MAEPAVPVARLEKLWRRFRQKYGTHLAEVKAFDLAHSRGYARGRASGYLKAAADLRAVIDDAKKEETR